MTNQVDLSDRSIKNIVDGLLTAQRMGGGPTGGGGGSNAGSSGVLDFLGRSGVVVTDAFTSSLAKATTGNLKFTDLLATGSQILGLFGNAGNLLNVTALKGAATFYEVNEQLKKTSESGFYFGNNLLDFSASVTGARLTTDQFINFVRENGSKITFLGAGADDSARKLLIMSKGLQDGDVTIKNFLKLGGTSEELTEILGLTVQSMGAVNYANQSTKEIVTKTAVNLVTEFDNLSRVTGINRKTLEANLAKETQKLEVSTYMRTLDDQQRARFIENTAALSKFGTNVNDLFNQFQVLGNVMPRSVPFFAAMGTAGPAFKEYALAVKDRSKSEEEILALRRKFEEEYATYLRSENAVRLAQGAEFGAVNNEVAKATATLMKENKITALEDQAEQRRLAHARNTGEQLSLDFFKKQIEDEVLNGKKLAEAGAEGTKIATMMNEINQNIATASGGIAANLFKFNGKIEQMITGIDNAMGVSKAFNVGGSLSSIEDARRTLGGEFIDKLLNDAKTQDIKNEMYKDKGLAPIGRTADRTGSNDQASNSKDMIDSLKSELTSLTSAINKSSTTSTSAISNTESTGLLNSAVEQLSKISNTMRELLDSSQQSVRQLKDVVTGVSNNRGK